MTKLKNCEEEKEAQRAGSPPSISRKELLILEILINNQRELFGLEMVTESRGQLKRGTVYVTLQRMAEKGLIESRPEPRPSPEVGIPRRMYRVTGYGQRVFAAYQAARLTFSPDMAVVGG